MATMNESEVITEVVELLSALIAMQLRISDAEGRHPSYDADNSDAQIKEANKKALALRVMRNEFEDLMLHY